MHGVRLMTVNENECRSMHTLCIFHSAFGQMKELYSDLYTLLTVVYSTRWLPRQHYIMQLAVEHLDLYSYTCNKRVTEVKITNAQPSNVVTCVEQSEVDR